MVVDAGLGLFIIWWLFFMIIFPMAAGIMRDLGKVEKETKE